MHGHGLTWYLCWAYFAFRNVFCSLTSYYCHKWKPCVPQIFDGNGTGSYHGPGWVSWKLNDATRRQSVCVQSHWCSLWILYFWSHPLAVISMCSSYCTVIIMSTGRAQRKASNMLYWSEKHGDQVKTHLFLFYMNIFHLEKGGSEV